MSKLRNGMSSSLVLHQKKVRKGLSIKLICGLYVEEKKKFEEEEKKKEEKRLKDAAKKQSKDGKKPKKETPVNISKRIVTNIEVGRGILALSCCERSNGGGNEVTREVLQK